MRGWKVTALQNWGVNGRCGKIGMCMSEILDDLFSGGVSLNPCRTLSSKNLPLNGKEQLPPNQRHPAINYPQQNNAPQLFN
jgi:hypothetical protein